jgi:hypothetical protein
MLGSPLVTVIAVETMDGQGRLDAR